MATATSLNPSYLYRGKVLNVVDGDTVDIDVDLGFYCRARIRFRLYGIDTPELTSSDPDVRAKAVLAKSYLTTLISGKDVIVRSIKTEKYGRWLGSVWLESLDVNAEMLKSGHAVAYVP